MRKTVLNTIYELAKNDSRIVFIGSDLGHKTLDNFAQELPEQFFMEGISESHIIGMAAGLALEGNIVYINTVASFLTRRCLDQIIVNLCLENLPVRLIGNGGGLVYGPQGPTHTVLEDFSIMRSIPRMTVIAPSDAIQAKEAIIESVAHDGPLYIRLGKGGEELLPDRRPFEIGKATVWETSSACPIVLITTGIMTQHVIKLQKLLCEQGVETTVVSLNTVCPLDIIALNKYLAQASFVITIEEHSIVGGLGSAIAEFVVDNQYQNLKLKRIAFEREFIDVYGRQEEIFELHDMSVDHLLRKVLRFIES